MLAFVLIVVGVALYLIFSAKAETAKEVRRQGGMLIKYSLLIEELGATNSQAKFEIKRVTDLELQFSVKYDSSIFVFTVFDYSTKTKIYVDYFSYIAGKETAQYEFPSQMNQKIMAETINADIFDKWMRLISNQDTLLK